MPLSRNPVDHTAPSPAIFDPDEVLGEQPDYSDAQHITPPAVPVRVVRPVQTIARAAESWQAGTLNVQANTQPQAPLIGRHPMRRALLVVNTGANSAQLAPTGNAATTSAAFTLAAGAAISMAHTAAVWPFSLLGTTLAFVAEYEDG